MFRLTNQASSVARGLCRVVVCASAMAGALPALADVQCHPDLAAARSAASDSHKPVLLIFTASWSPESTRFVEHTLASPEAGALIAACFEPVLVDVDAAADLTKRLQISHVPSGCVLGADDAPMATFECPEPPAAFVAAAARAAQTAAAFTTTAAGGDPGRATGTLAATTRPAADLAAAGGFAAAAGDGGPLSPDGDAAARKSAGRGSISLVTAKVRQLSDFATGSPTAAAATTIAMAEAHPPAAGPAPAAMGTPSEQPATNRFVSASVADEPRLPNTPPAWPAEAPATSSAFTNAAPAPASQPSIEPAATATPWISSYAPATAPPATAAASSDAAATATDQPAKSAATSTWSSFVEAFQKPFTIFSPSKPKAAEPPTMPPARPASPFAALAAAPTVQPQSQPQAQPLQNEPETPPVPDRHGSMPLGLEGYCPVTLAERGVWTEGRAQWGVRHRGRTYLFAGPEQQQAFLATPDRFAPALSGDDPVVAVEQGKSTPGRRAYGVTYQSRMYLFASPESRTAFSGNPERYTASVTLAERPAPTDGTRRY
jgi:YHS domain-containing protein